MKNLRIAVALLLIAICLFVASDRPSTSACAGSGSSTCVVSENACLKTMVLAKAVSSTVVVPSGSPGTFNAPVNLYIGCPVANNCGAACEGSTEPMSASLTISLFPASTLPPMPPAAATGTISTAAGTMTVPTCDPGNVPSPSLLGQVQDPPGFNSYTVPVTIPVGTPPGVYVVVGNAAVTFRDGMSLTKPGDTLVCLVEEAPGQPGMPRLDLRLLSQAFPRVAPGDQVVAEYQITNRDPLRSVTLTAFADSQQIAVRPKGGNERRGVFSIASPFGDDFPIAFDAGDCIPLPEHPYTQGEISKPLPSLGPGQSTTVRVRIRPYGQCGTGSCSESTFRVAGAFSDGTPARACGGIAAYVSTRVETMNCGSSVNDCNRNGVPDADDIFRRTSQDRNFNALPDECEQGAPMITEPVRVTPPVAVAGGTIRVSVTTSGQSRIASVLVDNVALSSSDGRLWEGELIAARDVGPQTVYALAKDAAGQLATHIGIYETRALGPGDVECHATCFRSSEYFLLNLNRLPRGSVLIGGVNFNSPVSIQSNLSLIRIALRGGSGLGVGALTPLQRLNQEFVSAQLNLTLAGGRGSPESFSVLRGNLSCYGLDFAPVTLSNGVTLAPGSRLMDIFQQAEQAIRQNRTADMTALANLLGLLNGNDPRNRCN